MEAAVLAQLLSVELSIDALRLHLANLRNDQVPILYNRMQITNHAWLRFYDYFMNRMGAHVVDVVLAALRDRDGDEGPPGGGGGGGGGPMRRVGGAYNARRGVPFGGRSILPPPPARGAAEDDVVTFVPQNVSLPASGGTASSNLIKNEGVSRMAFKIKSSNNAHYRVKPVYGFIDAGATVPVEIVRTAGKEGEDKMVIQYAEVPPEETNPKAPFLAGACQGEIIITLVAKLNNKIVKKTLAFEPQNVSLPASGGTASSNLIKNEGVARMAFKIKSSNNAHYRVKPVYGFIDAGATVPVEIVRKAGPLKKDKMFVEYAEVPPEETNPKAPFLAGACQGEIIISLVATP